MNGAIDVLNYLYHLLIAVSETIKRNKHNRIWPQELVFADFPQISNFNAGSVLNERGQFSRRCQIIIPTVVIVLFDGLTKHGFRTSVSTIKFATF